LQPAAAPEAPHGKTKEASELDDLFAERLRILNEWREYDAAAAPEAPHKLELISGDSITRDVAKQYAAKAAASEAPQEPRWQDIHYILRLTQQERDKAQATAAKLAEALRDIMRRSAGQREILVIASTALAKWEAGQ
jgi:hypothetical protein